jgi:transaldolase
VSVELAPHLAHDTGGSITAARGLHERIDEPNLMVKIPATAEGVRAVIDGIGSPHALALRGRPALAQANAAYHGRVARGIDDWTDDAFRTLEELAAVGIDFHDVSARLEHAGIVAFAHSFEHLLAIE